MRKQEEARGSKRKQAEASGSKRKQAEKKRTEARGKMRKQVEASGSKRKLLLDLVHRGEINTDDIGGGTPDKESPFLRLPTTETILKAFRMKDWSNTKSAERYVYPC